MGGIWGTRRDFIEQFKEICGYKTGLSLTTPNLLELIASFDIADESSLGSSNLVRLHSSEYEEVVNHLLYSLGYIDVPDPRFSSASLFHEIKHDPEKIEMHSNIISYFLDTWRENIVDGEIDPGPVLEYARNEYGLEGLKHAMSFLKGMVRQLNSSPWSMARAVNWVDEIELKDLFESEKLSTFHGKFFDQRYINYLQRNISELGRINWRKFEGLTAEFFARDGFEVSMGPGRGDGGIDIREFILREETRIAHQ